MHDNGRELTLNFPVCRIYTVIVVSDPCRRFHGTGEASNIWKVYARFGSRFYDSPATHN